MLEAKQIKSTCTLLNHQAGVYVIAKMAANKTDRKRGFGELLLQAVVRYACEKQADKIIISNTIIEPAINLYKKMDLK